MVKDLTGNKSKNSQETDTGDSSPLTMEELSAVFSIANFSLHSANKQSTVENEEDVEMDIGKYFCCCSSCWLDRVPYS